MKIAPSIVIKCCQDYRIFSCLNSIDIDCEIIVSLAGNGDLLEKEIRNKYRNVRIVEAPKGNLGLSTNLGIHASSGNALVIMDSDARFKQGTLAKIAKHLRNHLVVKPRIIYESLAVVTGSKMVAITRQQFNDSEVRALTPGLAFRKEVSDYIGGYYFDESVCFTEDAALDWRIRRAGIPIRFVPEAIVYHAPTSVWHDLRAGYRMGYGYCQAIKFAGRVKDRSMSSMVSQLITGRWLIAYREYIKRNGLCAASYQVFWNLCYHFGFLSESLRVAFRRAKHLEKTF